MKTAQKKIISKGPQKITPFLWFDDNAEEAVNFYTSVFKKSKINAVTHYGKGGPGPQGKVMTIAFELEGQQFSALNGGPHFKFTEAISFYIHCKTQAEIDKFWKLLSSGGKKGNCGWLKDKYGVSWQIVPEQLIEMLQSGNTKKISNLMTTLLQMNKLDIKKLKKAFEKK